MMGWFRPDYAHKGRNAEPRGYQHHVIRKLSEAQRLNEDVVYHGECASCLNLKGNSQGEGMRHCLGCAISTWSPFGENRQIVRADREDK